MRPPVEECLLSRQGDKKSEARRDYRRRTIIIGRCKRLTSGKQSLYYIMDIAPGLEALFFF